MSERARLLRRIKATSERARLLRRIKARLRNFRRTGDTAHILDRSAAAEASELLRLVPDLAADVVVVRAVAELYSTRFQTRHGTDEGSADASTALTLYTQIYPTHPRLVPDLFRDFLDEHWAEISDSRSRAAEDLMRDIRAAQQLYARDPGVRTRADLKEAVELFRRGLRILPAVHLGYASALSEKAVALSILYDYDKAQTLLEEANESHRQALAVTGAGHPNRAEVMLNFGLFLRKWYSTTGQAQAVTDAVSVGRQVLDSVPPDHPQAGIIFYELGESLHELFGLSGEAALLDVAIGLLTKSIGAHVPFTEGLSSIIYALSRAQYDLFQLNRDRKLLEYAAGGAQAAALIAQHEQPELAMFAHHAMIVLRDLYHLTQDETKLQEAVQQGFTAVAAAPKEHPDHATFQDDLLSTLMDLYQVTQDADVLLRAVAAGRNAVATATPDYPDRGRFLHNLSYVLHVQYGIDRNSIVLRETVKVGREAVAATPPGHPDRAAYLVSLGAFLQNLSNRHGNLEVLREAIAVTREAADSVPSGDPHHAEYLGNLAMIRYSLFTQQADIAVLTQALAEAREALALTAPGAAPRARLQSNLSVLLCARFTADADAGALPEALAAAREAAAALPAGTPDHTTAFAQLGRCLRLSFELSAQPGLVADARQAFTTAAQTAGSARVRIVAWRGLAWAELTGGNPTEALHACEQAIDLVQEVSAPRSWRWDRRDELSDLAGLAGEVATIAIRAGRPDRALELLERTRGTLLAEAIGWRGDQAELQARAPELAEKYAKLRDAMDLAEQLNHGDAVLLKVPGLDKPAAMPHTGGTDFDFDADNTPDDLRAYLLPRIAAWRRELELGRNDLLNRIRQVDGLDSFLATPSSGELQAQAAEGPVVLITVSTYGADALIVTTGSLHTVPLPGVTPHTVRDRVDRLVRATSTASTPSLPARRQAQRELGDLLGWLWDRITAPVLEELGFTGSPEAEDSWPRIWWCPIGEIALLPVHAAGHHDLDLAQGEAPPTVMDRVVSSYTPTLRALHHARAAYARTSSVPGDGQRGALVVVMPNTPEAEASPIPGALAEAARIQSLIPGSRTLTGSEAIFEAVTEGLKSHRIAHLACHGLNNRSNPDASMLLLHDHASRPLTVNEVGRQQLGDADLAYLSACSTTQSSPWLADEALHITSAFQLAGYSHVIGTLWPINDAVATRIADEFYTDLTQDGTTAPRTDRAPHALHRAIRRLRSDYMASPALWAAHIHVGL